ncbi:NapC/NirT family cytochrome c [Shewanella sp. 3B26]|jgi:cytochrome c-type protein NapC|uniref:Cytochrome c-type protein n=1 Tax=Shewanella zhuhaiensis TaxID=2919576 RepID=A0AAJ1BI74_9GAMM|nr:NapC/NirT family cytochrome c [Shewanella zhuhaiensis]MCH4295197.1 NapC/NirT family cytochrome c [Shewanella zhuhaiensis]
MNWRALFKPSAKYSIFALLLVGIVVGVVGYFATQTTLHMTSTDEFCMSCHSNHSLKDEVLASAHGNNKNGIVVQCQQCHIAQEPFAYLKKKIIVSKDVIGFLTIDGFNTQEWLEANRKEQADLARDYLRAIDSSTCQNCHNRIYENQSENMSKMAVRMHSNNFKKEPEKRKTCIDCHKGVAHPYPKS